MRPALRRPAVLAALVVGVGALAGGGFVWYVARGPRQVRGGELEELLGQAEAELAQGYTRRAGEQLRKALAASRGEQALLRVLKRAYRMAQSSGDHRELARLALAAHERAPGSTAVARVAALALLRDGQAESAVRVLGALPRRRELDGLRLEAYLRGQGPAPGRQSLEPRLRTILEAAETKDPSRLLAAAEASEEPDLALDAALLWARAGKTEEALAAAWPYRQRPEMAEPLAYLAYDAGRLAEALELVDRLEAAPQRPGLEVLSGDILWRLGRWEEAAGRYQEAIKSAPGYSWTPYLNLAAVVEQLGDPEGARNLRTRAYALFPAERRVALAHARDLVAAGAPARGRAVLQKLLAEVPGDPEAQLLALEMEGTAARPGLYQGRMWQLLGAHPGDPAVVRSFFVYLLELRDLEGAAAVLAEYERSGGAVQAAWLPELKGLAAAARGRFEEAVGYLGESVRREPEWRRRYNLALALAAVGRTGRAVEELIQAETELLAAARGRDTPPDWGLEGLQGGQREARSRIRARLAEIYAGERNTEAARREAAYALELDPGNRRARLVLRILDAE